MNALVVETQKLRENLKIVREIVNISIIATLMR